MGPAHVPEFDVFCALARQGNLVPVYREILADLETPVSAFLKIDDGGDAFLLESVEGERNGGATASWALRRARSCASRATPCGGDLRAAPS